METDQLAARVQRLEQALALPSDGPMASTSGAAALLQEENAALKALLAKTQYQLKHVTQVCGVGQALQRWCAVLHASRQSKPKLLHGYTCCLA